MTGAGGWAPSYAHARGGVESWLASCLRPNEPAARATRATATGVAPVLGLLGACAFGVLGMAVAGIDGLLPVAERGVPPPSIPVAAEEAGRAADTAPESPAPAALAKPVPARSRISWLPPPGWSAHLRPAAVLTARGPDAPKPALFVDRRRTAALPEQPIAIAFRPVAAAFRLLSPPARTAPPTAPIAPAAKPRAGAHTGPAGEVPPGPLPAKLDSGLLTAKPLVIEAGAGSMVRRAMIPTVAAVTARFASIKYDLAGIRAAAEPVPRLYLDALPRDLAHVSSIEAKKSLFIQTVLPVVLRVNEELAAARGRVEKLLNQIMWFGEIARADREWLERIAERYGTDPFDSEGLLSRLDIVPPSLALAQAVEESGWGTSRFVQEGNALFGQYTYKVSSGMLPKRRDTGQTHYVRSHETLLQAVSAYAHNLNSHWAYEDFRRARARLRRAGGPISGYDLAKQLTRYSERGVTYIRAIRRIIRQNGLDDFDRAQLHDRRWTAAGGSPDQQRS